MAARVPSEGLLINLAQGCDVVRWCREGLIDQLHVDALSWSAGGDAQDVRPYIRLARQYGIRIVGSAHVNTFDPVSVTGPDERPGLVWSNPVAFLRRILGLAEAGVDAVELYESEVMCHGRPSRWLVAMAGHPDEARHFLDHSNLEACFPVHAHNAMGGLDNHSTPGRYTLFDGPDDVMDEPKTLPHRRY